MTVTLKRHPHAPNIRYFEIDGVRHYVKRTNLRTYVVATCWPFTLDDMVEINGEYHFSTLAELRNAAASHAGPIIRNEEP